MLGGMSEGGSTETVGEGEGLASREVTLLLVAGAGVWAGVGSRGLRPGGNRDDDHSDRYKLTKDFHLFGKNCERWGDRI